MEHKNTQEHSLRFLLKQEKNKKQYFIKNIFTIFFFLISVSNPLRLESWPSSVESPRETSIIFKASYTYKIPH